MLPRGALALLLALGAVSCGDPPAQRADPAGTTAPVANDPAPPVPVGPLPDPAPRAAVPLEVAVRLRVVDARGEPIPDAQVAWIFTDPAAGLVPARQAEPGVFLTAPMPLPMPEERALVVSAPGRVDALLRPLQTRPDGGVIDLGDIALAVGRSCRLEAAAGGAPAAGAAIYAVLDGSPFPPRDPGAAHRVITRLEDPPLARTDAAGQAVVGVRPEGGSFVVCADGVAPALLRIEGDAAVAPVELVPGHPVSLTTRTDALARVPGNTVEATLDLGGLHFVQPLPVNAPHVIRLDRPRPLRVRIDARTFASLILDVPAGTAAVELPLAAAAVSWIRIEARDAATDTPLPVTGLSIGRARDDEPDRIDFVPDWTCLPLVSAGEARAAAPPGRYDLLVTADGYLETLVRGVEVRGTESEPGIAQVALRPAPPVSGTVLRPQGGGRVAGAHVLIRRTSRDLDDLPLLWKVAGTVGLLGSLETGSAGTFTFRTSAWEDIDIEVLASGMAPDRLPRTARERASNLMLLMTGGCRVSGRWTGAASGGPWPTTAYLADLRHIRLHRTPVRSDGTFEFPHVPKGRYRLYVDHDDRPLFAGRHVGLDTALVEEMHHGARGVAVEVQGDLSGLSAPLEEATPLPCTAVVDLGSAESGVARVVAIRCDGRVPERRVTAGDAGGRRRVVLPPLAAGPHALLAEDPAGRVLALAPFIAAWPETSIAIDPRPGRLRVAWQGAGGVRLIASAAALPGELANAAGQGRIAAVELAPQEGGDFAAELPAGDWRVAARDATGTTVWSGTVRVPAGGEAVLDAPR